MTEDEMVGWHHRLDEHEFEQAPGDGEGQEGLVCCSPWGHKELDMTLQPKKNNASIKHFYTLKFEFHIILLCHKYYSAFEFFFF